MRSQLCRRDGALTGFCVLRHTQFHNSYQPAEILITSSITSQHRYRYNRLSKVRRPRSKVLTSTLDIGHWTLDFYSDFRSNMRLDTGLFGRQMKPRRPVDSITIEEGHGGHLMRRTGSD